MVKKESKMIKEFLDILEQMRHLNRDEKGIFYAFVYEDRENLSLLSLPELKTLEKFSNRCFGLISDMWPPDAVDDDFPHTSDQLYNLVDQLPLEIFKRHRRNIESKGLGPITGCESCGWINGYTDHKVPYLKEFEKNPEICPACRSATIVISKDSVI